MARRSRRLVKERDHPNPSYPPALAGGPCGGSRSRHTASVGKLAGPGPSAGLVSCAGAEGPGGKALSGREHRALGLLIMAAGGEIAGQRARGRGIVFERRVAATGPALGGVPGQPLLSEATTAVAVAPPPLVRMRMQF